MIDRNKMTVKVATHEDWESYGERLAYIEYQTIY